VLFDFSPLLEDTNSQTTLNRRNNNGNPCKFKTLTLYSPHSFHSFFFRFDVSERASCTITAASIMSRLAYDPDFDDDWGKGVEEEVDKEDASSSSVVSFDASATSRISNAIADGDTKKRAPENATPGKASPPSS
jgi:hypothetical protein